MSPSRYAVIAFIFMRLNLVRPGAAAASAFLSATIFRSGGIIGPCHHLYFSGTPTVALAWGSVFSALGDTSFRLTILSNR